MYDGFVRQVSITGQKLRVRFDDTEVSWQDRVDITELLPPVEDTTVDDAHASVSAEETRSDQAAAAASVGATAAAATSDSTARSSSRIRTEKRPREAPGASGEQQLATTRR